MRVMWKVLKWILYIPLFPTLCVIIWAMTMVGTVVALFILDPEPEYPDIEV